MHNPIFNKNVKFKVDEVAMKLLSLIDNLYSISAYFEYAHN